MRMPNTALGGSGESAPQSILSRSPTGMAGGAIGKLPPPVFVPRKRERRCLSRPPSTRVGRSGTRGPGGEQSAGAKAPRAEVGAAWVAALLVRLDYDYPHRNFTGQRCRLSSLRMQPTQGPRARV